MFGFLIKGEVNDDAVRLKALTDQVMAKYMSKPRDQLLVDMSKDFPAESIHIDSYSVSFSFPEVPSFNFMLDYSRDSDPSDRFLTVFGGGKYAGFTLHASKHGWHCSVDDGISYRATGGAKKLVQIMEKKFDVRNMSRLLKQFR